MARRDYTFQSHIVTFQNMLKLLSNGGLRPLFSQFQPKEIIDSYWEVEKKVQQLASALSAASHPIIFTGAGISTSIGIPDYRSGQETIIRTGPGLWNRDLSNASPHETPIDRLVDIAKPSLSHMAIASLLKQGRVKHLISQNTDGLHVRSGIPLEKISELHGNRNLQYCIQCQRKYCRDFRTLKRDGRKYYPGEKRDHSTGRQCQNCGGDLHDSIVYFGEKLPSSQLESAVLHANHADLCLCLGSSLTVKPSSNIPALVAKKSPPGKLCIINIQETPLDGLAGIRINYFCDEVMELLAGRMGLKVEKLVVRHTVRMVLEVRPQGYWLEIEGKDQYGNNLTFIKSVSFNFQGGVQEIQSKGHKCSIELTKGQMRSLQTFEIMHFGDKNPLKIDFPSLPLSAQRPLGINYASNDGETWQIDIQNAIGHYH